MLNQMSEATITVAAVPVARWPLRGPCSRRQHRASHRDARAVGQPVDGSPRQGAPARSRTRPSSRVTLKYFEGGSAGRRARLRPQDQARPARRRRGDRRSASSMIDESIRVLELPMMFQSVEELDYVADKMWPYFQAKFEKKGYKLNDRGEVGWIYFMSKNEVEVARRPQGPEAVAVGRRSASSARCSRSSASTACRSACPRSTPA